MIMYSLICYNHGIRIINSCLNVLPDRTSGRSASIIVSENLFKQLIRIKGRESKQTNLNWKESTKVKNRNSALAASSL